MCCAELEWNWTIAGLDRAEIVSAQGVRVVTDTVLTDDIGIFDLIFLPGGMPGSLNLAESEVVTQLLQQHQAEEKLIAAICAAPAKVLAPNKLLDNKRATCYPGNMDEIASIAENITLLEDSVVVDGNVITSRGVGTALELGYKLVEILFDSALAQKLRQGMVATN